ncbi:ATP-binding protein [Dankookia sp. P2]|uniref:ATP-binding protein n=1 Tax=Dankookia sp. P2 TaxID=3423955 RepID=UPI003D6775F3
MDALGPADLLALLHDRFGLLNQGRRSDPPRHQGLLATLDWSHDLLPEVERRVLRRLAVLAGPFILDAAVAVAGDDDVTPCQVIDGVARLVAQSLVAARPAGRTMQYRLLDTMRAYALRKLAESGEADAVHRRHATHCLALCREIAGWLRRSPSDASVADEERTVDNLRAALTWAFSISGDPPLGCTLTVAALPVWDAFSRLQDCVTYVEHARAVAATAPRFEREHMMLCAALAVARLQTGGPSQEVEALWRQTLHLAECLEDTEYRLRALWGICDYRSWVGDHRAALALTEESRGLAERMGDCLALRNGERQAATSLRYLGRFDEARRLAEGLLDQVGRRGAAPDVPRFQNDPRVVAQGTLANLLWLQGHPDQAVDAATLALERAQRSGHPFAVTNALAHTAIPISLYVGDLDGAERLLAMLDEQVAQQVMPIWRAVGQCLHGILLLRRGRVEGLEQLEDGLEALAATGFRMRYPAYLGAQASGLAAQGRLAEADRVLDTAFSWSGLNGEDWCHAELLRLRGALAARRGEGGTAEHWLGEALALARHQGALAWELRAATSLATFWQQAGRPDDASRLLGAVVARFDEGRDGADMAVARRVLAGGAARPLLEAATLA